MKINRYNGKTVHIVFDATECRSAELADFIGHESQGRIEPIEIRYHVPTQINTIICRCSNAQQAELERLLQTVCSAG